MDISTPLIAILLAFTRVASFLYVIPLFKGRYVPHISKLAIALSIAIFVQDKMHLKDVISVGEFSVLLLMQIMMGLTLGYVVSLIFAIPQIAGGLLDMDMGYSSSSVIDPSNGTRITLLSNMYSVLFMLIFIMLGGIENLLYGIVLSFHFTKVVFFVGNLTFLDTLMQVFQYMLVSAVQIALPIIAAMFIVNVMMLIIGKIAPQLNIMMNMFPIKIAVGMMFIYFTIPIAGELFADITNNLQEHYLDVLESMFTK